MSASSPQPEMRCILYCDIVGSTAESVEARREGKDAVLHTQRQRFLDVWCTALQRERKEFSKSLGDGLLATFTDPMDALRGVVRVRQALKTDAECSAIPVRAGLHVGTVTVLPDGDIDGADACLGARVMQAAQKGQVLASGAFADIVNPYRPSHCSLTDLGDFFLPGFDTPISLYQLCGPDFSPEILTPAAKCAAPALPIALDRFVGRKQNLRRLRSLLADPVQRCVTITGTAGCGKTRLALEIARQVKTDFYNRVYFVPLEEATDAGGVLTRLAAAMSVSVSPNADILQTLVTALSGRRVLLVLDNFEQVLSAAANVTDLLQALPSLHVLITSRERLWIRGERVYDLDPLDVPAPSASYQEIRTNESVSLFVMRVQAAYDRFRLTETNAPEVAELCRIVAGLPLALEIVAAEVRHRPLGRLLSEIRTELLDITARETDLPERRRTLRATFDWSYNHLEVGDRLLFAQLGLFETAFTEEDVFDVCTGGDLEAGMRRLREKGLVCCDGPEQHRPFRLLVPAREYARLRMGRPEGAFRRRFISVFTRRAQCLYDTWYSNGEPEALRGVQTDLENFRAAWRLACEDGNPEAIADLGMTVTLFAPILPRAANIASWVEETEYALQQLGDRQRLGLLHNRRARLAAYAGSYVESVRYQRMSLELLSNAGTPLQIADAHSTLAMFAYRAQDYPTAEHHAQLCLEYSQSMEAADPQATSLFILARLQLPHDLNQAVVLAERSLATYRKVGSDRGMAHAITTLAHVAELRGELAPAESQLQEALRLCWGQGEPIQTVRCLETLAKFYGKHGEHERANELLVIAAAMQRTQGMPETARLALPASCADRQLPPTPLEVAVLRILSEPLVFR